MKLILITDVIYLFCRQLDVQTLVSASRVSRRWYALCQSDSVLRKRVRDEIHRQRTAHIYPLRPQIYRSTQNVSRPFTFMNGLQEKIVTYATGMYLQSITSYIYNRSFSVDYIVCVCMYRHLSSVYCVVTL